MRRICMVVCLLIVMMAPLSADPSANLYTLVVPQEYTRLYVNGAFGSIGPNNDAVQLNLDFTPSVSLGMNLGLNGTYDWYRLTEDTVLDIDANGGLRITDTSLFLNLDTDPSYQAYAFDVSGFPGFWKAGLDFDLTLTLPYSSPASVQLFLYPMGEFGVGRIYGIYTLKKIETIMRHMDIEPTEAMIREVAEIMYTQNKRLGEFSDDYSENYLSYYRAITQALGKPEETARLILIDNNQRYAFELERYVGLRHGWEASVRIIPGFKYIKSPPSAANTDFVGSFEIAGEYAGFLMENMLHVGADGGVRLALDTSLTPNFYAVIGASGTATYLPENYRWWASGTVDVNFYSTRTEKLAFSLRALGNYLINPNFRVHGGVSLSTLSDRLSVFAGGQIRVW